MVIEDFSILLCRRYYKLKNRDAQVLGSTSIARTMQCQDNGMLSILSQVHVCRCSPTVAPSTVYCNICCRKERPGITCLLATVLLRKRLRAKSPIHRLSRTARLLASVPGLPLSVRILIMHRRQSLHMIMFQSDLVVD